MLVKPDQKCSPSSSATTTAAAQTSCGNCGAEELRFLHHVRHRGAFRRLCPSCVLRHHPSAFCPVCFAVYDSTSPPPTSAANDPVSCSKCYSTLHAACAGSNPPNPYFCPICVNPNSPIFAPKKLKDLASENPGAAAANGKDAVSGDLRVIDQRAARVLLAAAKISADSMSKAAVAARAEAERRAREAAFSRKRARTALEHVAYMVAKEKSKKRGAATDASAGGGGGMVVNNTSVNTSNNNNNNAGNASVASVMRAGNGIAREERRVGNVGRGEGGDGSSDVLAALNAVELIEGEKMGRQPGPPLARNDVVPMDVEENGNIKGNGGLNDGRVAAGHHGGARENGDHSENHSGTGENATNGDRPGEPKNNPAGPLVDECP